MVNAASIVQSPTLASAPLVTRAERAFSFDEAVASARRNAARALEVHGAAPTEEVTRAGGAAQQDAGETPAPTSTSTAAQASPAPARRASAQAATVSTQSSAAPAPATSNAATAAAPVLAIAAPLAPGSVQAASSAIAPAREAAARLKAEIVRTALPARAPSAATTQFAEILARRLDGASQFDLRLDPPALGGVEGRLTLSDDGAAQLTLAFDNPSAFDQFRRDEAALRQALANAGFDLPRENLQMTFRAPARVKSEARAEPAAVETRFTPAPLHRGAVDIRA